MLIVLGIVLLLSVTLLPQLLVRRIIKKHGADRPDLPGTGGELARHLLDRFGLETITVEETDLGDHYDPDARAVRLLKQHHDSRSLSAAAVAAHEVGHALQHARGERMLAWRQRLAKLAMATDRIASVFFIAAPVLAILARTPLAFAALVAVGLALMSVRVIVNLVTLPVEFDASFGKALPILQEGKYLNENDMPAAKSVLRAAAFTYVASALVSLINLARWIRVLR